MLSIKLGASYMKFKFFSLIVMPALLLPFLVLAQTSNDFRQLPAFNPICWEEETCLQVRSQTATTAGYKGKARA
jgi:hypothetical protein